MDCLDCQELISEYLDGELDAIASAPITAHLSACIECSILFDDFASILANCREGADPETVPPNPQALWCRIQNVIEADNDVPRKTIDVDENSSLRGRRFSFAQIGAAVACVAILSSLLTVIGIRNYFEPSGEDVTSRSQETQTTFEKALSSVGLIDGPREARNKRLAQQMATIDYWNKRVQARRQQWDARMRDAFDRNVNEIDNAVSEYTVILEVDPEDQLSSEMLDSALNEKMNLLKEFAEL